VTATVQQQFSTDMNSALFASRPRYERRGTAWHAVRIAADSAILTFLGKKVVYPLDNLGASRTNFNLGKKVVKI
jgi:hypothetical protein